MRLSDVANPQREPHVRVGEAGRSASRRVKLAASPDVKLHTVSRTWFAYSYLVIYLILAPREGSCRQEIPSPYSSLSSRTYHDKDKQEVVVTAQFVLMSGQIIPYVSGGNRAYIGFP